jgi:putative oxidoreductase
MGVTRFLGRVLFAAIFILAGVNKLQDVAKTAGYVGFGLNSSGVTGAILKHTGFNLAPFYSQLAMAAAIIEVLGGILLVLGAEKAAASIILPFLLAVTPIMHWPMKAGQMDEMQFIQVLKNAALAGACLMLLDAGRRASGAKHHAD